MQVQKRILLFALIVYGLVSSAPLFAQPAAPFVNPLLPRHADPWIYRHVDGFYYFSCTVPEFDRIELRRSMTIGGLRTAEPLAVWKRHLFGEMAGNIWAPEIHFIDGTWYIYFAAGSRRSPYDVRPYVLENRSLDPLKGKWTERGKIRTNWDAISLDATTFESDGTRYLVWAQRTTEGMSGSLDLYIARMVNPWTIEQNQVRISTADRPWELRKRRTNEGPAVLQRNGRLFITYSANYIDATYCVGMLTAQSGKDLLDPKSWSKSDFPVFDSDPAMRVWGPGHNSFTTSPDGKVDYLVYHARPAEAVTNPAILDPNRDTRVQPFGWRANGTPDFGTPVRDDQIIR